jgi:hypothetical protein
MRADVEIGPISSDFDTANLPYFSGSRIAWRDHTLSIGASGQSGLEPKGRIPPAGCHAAAVPHGGAKTPAIFIFVAALAAVLFCCFVA